MLPDYFYFLSDYMFVIDYLKTARIEVSMVAGFSLVHFGDGSDESNPEYRVIASERLTGLVRNLQFGTSFSYLPETISARDVKTALIWALESMELEWFYVLEGEFVQVVGPDGTDTHYFTRNPRYEGLEGRFEHHGVQMEAVRDETSDFWDIGSDLSLIRSFLRARAFSSEHSVEIAITPYMPDRVIDDLLSTVNVIP